VNDIEKRICQNEFPNKLFLCIVSLNDFNAAFSDIRLSGFQGALMAEKPDSVHWSDIGGLTEAKVIDNTNNENENDGALLTMCLACIGGISSVDI
jgi:SpoVK/Ycf46/Vps4 family AAA+-type ATPase